MLRTFSKIDFSDTISEIIWEYSAIPSEGETLFSPNSQFQIISEIVSEKSILEKILNIDLQGFII